ncbi:MAG TPA: adenylate/guanylate cyclase domain-containing protein [Beijerinckiaceae bacterium]|jgi:adenylate cyclase
MTIEQFIIEQGINGTSISHLLEGVAERLIAEGLPLCRVYAAIPTVNAAARVYNHVWLKDVGSSVEPVSHERVVGGFEASPFGYMLANEITRCHWHLAGPNEPEFPVFEDLRAVGARDYLAHLMSFNNPEAPAIRGMACAFSSDRPDGFTPVEAARLDGLVPLMSLAAYRMVLLSIATHTLDLYVGLSAGRQVLNGQVRRGVGERLEAALMVADLRGFTGVADAAGPGLIARLDAHLEAMADPVHEHGGEVLKFLGDGLLAAFPITPERGREEACAAALAAAREALSRNAAVNAGHPNGPLLDLDVALHCGEVFHGNIGGTRRLDFTVIGPAVNETCRLESLCGTLDCNLILSRSVAEACGASVRSLGHHRLRGVAEPREAFALA